MVTAQEDRADRRDDPELLVTVRQSIEDLELLAKVRTGRIGKSLGLLTSKVTPCDAEAAASDFDGGPVQGTITWERVSENGQ